jgi:hypothetical protein
VGFYGSPPQTVGSSGGVLAGGYVPNPNVMIDSYGPVSASGFSCAYSGTDPRYPVGTWIVDEVILTFGAKQSNFTSVDAKVFIEVHFRPPGT